MLSLIQPVRLQTESIFKRNRVLKTQTPRHQANQDRQDHWRRRRPQLVPGQLNSRPNPVVLNEPQLYWGNEGRLLYWCALQDTQGSHQRSLHRMFKTYCVGFRTNRQSVVQLRTPRDQVQRRWLFGCSGLRNSRQIQDQVPEFLQFRLWFKQKIGLQVCPCFIREHRGGDGEVRTQGQSADDRHQRLRTWQNSGAGTAQQARHGRCFSCRDWTRADGITADRKTARLIEFEESDCFD